MFINLSNHPSSKWTAEQKEAAQEMGGSIVDVQFPQVDPTWDQLTVRHLANGKFAEIFENRELPITCHVMGESGFIFEFVRLCKEADVKVVHSTTSREVVENEDGSKTSVFKFVQFREY